MSDSRPVSAGAKVIFSVISGAAILIIVLLLAVAVNAQFGPGGIASEIRIGDPAPDFELPLLEGGEAVRLSDYAGRPVAINFWATYCPNCVLELPALMEGERRFAEQDFAVIYLNAGQNREHVRAWLVDHRLALPVVADPGKSTYKAWNIKGLPTTIWVDRAGLVHDVTLGGLITIETVEEQLRAMGELGEG